MSFALARLYSSVRMVEGSDLKGVFSDHRSAMLLSVHQRAGFECRRFAE